MHCGRRAAQQPEPVVERFGNPGQTLIIRIREAASSIASGRPSRRAQSPLDQVALLLAGREFRPDQPGALYEQQLGFIRSEGRRPPCHLAWHAERLTARDQESAHPGPR